MAKSEGDKYFFRTFTDVQSQNETRKNGKKSTFQILRAYITKMVEVMAKSVWGAMLGIKLTIFWHRPKIFPIFQKLEN